MNSTDSQVVDESLAGQTVLAALRHADSALSWRAARELLAARKVTVNGTACREEARRLHVGDVIEVLSKPSRQPPRSTDICIRYFDHDIVVVEKPAGMLTERPAAESRLRKRGTPRDPSLDELLPRVIAEYSGHRLSPDERDIWIVHRLDRDASGLLVAARTVNARDQLIKQFAARTPSRIYQAIVVGRVEAQTIRTHFVRDRGDGKRGSLERIRIALPVSPAANSETAQLAITHVRPIAFRRGRTLLECRLETGRTNQIRIHLAELGHPIFGDIKYGLEAAKSSTQRLALHASELEFQHPVTGEPRHFTGEWPPELDQLWNE